MGHGAEADVLASGELIANEVLEDDGDPSLPSSRLELAEIDALDGDAAPGRFVQTGQELDERGLPGSVRANDREGASGGDREIQIAEDVVLAARVPEPHPLEADPHRRRLIAGAHVAWGRYRLTGRSL